MNWFERLQLGLNIYAQVQVAELAIKEAEIGDVVYCGTLKGVRCFGRKIDLPLKFTVKG